mgnify:CR=1 FL=1
MDDLQKRIQDSMQRAQDQAQAQIRNMQVDRMNRQHHIEMLNAQQQIVASNYQVANEVHGIKNTLQEQINDNRKEIEESKVTEKKLSKRSWWQFGLSFGIAIAGVVVAIIALFR